MIDWIIIAYVAISTIIGGYSYHQHSDAYDHQMPIPIIIGIGWPLAFLWIIVLKPLAKLGISLGKWQDNRRQAHQLKLAQIRAELEKLEREHLIHMEVANREVEQTLTHNNSSG